jgi:ABC-2 type transport system permease protein
MSLLMSELRLRWVSVVTWTVAVALLVLLIVGIYPTVKDNPDLNSIYEGMPASAQALLGGSDLTSPVGYLNTQMFAFFLPAVLLVFGISRGAAAIAGEEEDRTLDLLLAQPVTRTGAYLQKALFVAVGVLALTLASWVPIVALNGVVELDLPVADVTAVCLQMGLFVLALALSTQAIAAATGRRMWGTAAVGAYAFVSYLVYGLAATVSWLEPLKPLTLWRWYLDNEPLSTGFGGEELLVLALVSVVAVALGTYAFNRRDLRS